jgi:hypothetical protein
MGRRIGARRSIAKGDVAAALREDDLDDELPKQRAGA